MMCQKAVDIQHVWAPKQCDFMIDREDLEDGLSFCKPGAGLIQVVDIYFEDQASEQYQQECEDLKENVLWLPRQDQLQKIIEPDDIKAISIVREVIEEQYYYPSKGEEVAATNIFYSMEQLLLAFVMKEKFNKIWDEEDWISAKKD
jgi:hypothetical protein